MATKRSFKTLDEVVDELDDDLDSDNDSNDNIWSSESDGVESDDESQSLASGTEDEPCFQDSVFNNNGNSAMSDDESCGQSTNNDEGRERQASERANGHEKS